MLAGLETRMYLQFKEQPALSESEPFQPEGEEWYSRTHLICYFLKWKKPLLKYFSFYNPVKPPSLLTLIVVLTPAVPHCLHYSLFFNCLPLELYCNSAEFTGDFFQMHRSRTAACNPWRMIPPNADLPSRQEEDAVLESPSDLAACRCHRRRIQHVNPGISAAHHMERSLRVM